ncbi:MAG: putative nucleotidyltransferase substrate binding domain-containing protein [Usitatibacteraceae bacterium]
MPNAFNFSESPFDGLNPDEQRLVRNSVDITYFRAGETILELGAQPTHLFVIIKGVVHQYDGTEVINTYGVNDCFDGRGLVAGRVSSRFVAVEEVVAYQLAKDAVSSLIASNANFGAMLFSDLSNKLVAISQRQSQHELRSLTMARVDEAFVRPAHFVDADTDIVSIVKLFQAERTTTVLVRDDVSVPPQLGIFTHTGLQKAILSGTPLHELAVRELTNFSLISVRPSEQLGDALAVMIQKRVHRVVVAELGEDGKVDSARIVGILEALDLFSFMSNHSYLISIQIMDSNDLASLARAALHINRLIALLHQGGTKVSLIATLVQELNARLFERAWQLIAPADLLANSCLFVMGSEGRGEQLLKTDQDNGLIIRDGYTPPPNLPEICAQFSQALRDFGYPDCPGNIMVSNPVWRQTTRDFSQTARQWLLMPTPDTLMSLAIFLDAHGVSGDGRLLEEVRRQVFELVTDTDAMLARFASAINSFTESGGWWNRLLSLGEQNEDELDLKKAGIFPLVHGIRSMALEQRLDALGTAPRIQQLVAAGKLTAEMGADLTESLHFFMGVKLKVGLGELAMNRSPSGTIRMSKLSSLDRDLLKDTLGVVKRFKGLMRQRFHLDLVS